jgi:hypothetical protein
MIGYHTLELTICCDLYFALIVLEYLELWGATPS